MKNKGLLALGAILCLMLGALGHYTIMPTKEVPVPFVVNQTLPAEIVYVNSTVDAFDKETFDKVHEETIRDMEVEDAASIAFAMEFDVKDLEDALEEELDSMNLTLDDIESIKEDEDEEDIKVIRNGLDDAEDTKVIVEKTFKVRYEDEESTDTHKVEVLARGVITFDEDDNEYNCKIKYSLI